MAAPVINTPGHFEHRIKTPMAGLWPLPNGATQMVCR